MNDATLAEAQEHSVKPPDGIENHFLHQFFTWCIRRHAISKVSWNGNHLSGDKPSKKHLALSMYRVRPQEILCGASAFDLVGSCICLADINPSDALPAITAHHVMRVGQLPVVDYFPPGDPVWLRWSSDWRSQPIVCC